MIVRRGRRTAQLKHSKCEKLFVKTHNREFTQRQEYDYDYVNGCLKGLGLIVIVSLNVGLR